MVLKLPTLLNFYCYNKKLYKDSLNDGKLQWKLLNVIPLGLCETEDIMIIISKSNVCLPLL